MSILRRFGLPLLLTLVFCIQMLLPPHRQSEMIELMALHTDAGMWADRPWSVLTYGMVHGSALHFLSVMALLMCLQLLFRYERRYSAGVAFVIGTVVGGFVFMLIAPLLVPEGSTLIGASAGVCAIVPAAIAALYGRRMTLWQIVVRVVPIAFILLSDMSGLFYDANRGALAHIGGYIGGGLYLGMIALRRHRERSVADRHHRDRVEDILAKANTSGYAALTDEERSILGERREKSNT